MVVVVVVVELVVVVAEKILPSLHYCPWQVFEFGGHQFHSGFHKLVAFEGTVFEHFMGPKKCLLTRQAKQKEQKHPELDLQVKSRSDCPGRGNTGFYVGRCEVSTVSPLLAISVKRAGLGVGSRGF